MLQFFRLLYRKQNNLSMSKGLVKISAMYHYLYNYEQIVMCACSNVVDDFKGTDSVLKSMYQNYSVLS